MHFSLFSLSALLVGHASAATTIHKVNVGKGGLVFEPNVRDTYNNSNHFILVLCFLKKFDH